MVVNIVNEVSGARPRVEFLIVLVNPTKLTINLHNLVFGYLTKSWMHFDSLN